jgi:hypothetical protein
MLDGPRTEGVHGLAAASGKAVSWFRPRIERIKWVFWPRRMHGDRGEGWPSRWISPWSVWREYRTRNRWYRLAANAVDIEYYLSKNPDVRAAGLDPVAHYLECGWVEGRDPSATFSTQAYLDQNPDVAAASFNPLVHYLSHGSGEGRNGNIGFGGQNSDYVDGLEPFRALIASEFDPIFYDRTYSDVSRTGVDPLTHYLRSGAAEGRNPNASFRTLEYLEMYPDVGEAGLNPFAHYLMAGRLEGRKAREDHGFRYKVLSALKSTDERLEDAQRWAPAFQLSAPEALRAALSTLQQSRHDRVFITVSHDDFTCNVGGVQLCLQREAAALEALGWDHVHLYPATALPSIAPADHAAPLGVLLNGAKVGYFEPDVIAQVAAGTLGERGQVSFAIHSLLGHAVEKTANILHAVGAKSGYFWVHDFTAGCAGYHLARNDVEFCGAPPPDSTACMLCVYGERRVDHLKAHRQLFQDFALTVIAPSQGALTLWKHATGITPGSERVHPHCHLEQQPISADPAVRPLRSKRRLGARRPIRVAFLGSGFSHKGWSVFQSLAADLAHDPRYSFFHLATRTEALAHIAFEQVSVSWQNPAAMVEALGRLKIDLVILWSIWPETFSFVAHEAAAAGVALITTEESGNIARLVKSRGCGVVLRSEAELSELFVSGRAVDIAQTLTGLGHYDLHYSNMTADLLAEVGG